MIPEPAGLDDLAQQTRAAAFRLLLETGRAVSAAQIAAELKAASWAVEGELHRLDAAGLILGTHLLGQHAEDVINLFGLAIRTGIHASDLKHTVFAYPTSASDLSSML
jgi:pyruvate/2-oxoglutarate dehydrogenase complex dihydrolipoamide dehydrogenase (E3) component